MTRLYEESRRSGIHQCYSPTCCSPACPVSTECNRSELYVEGPVLLVLSEIEVSRAEGPVLSRAEGTREFSTPFHRFSQSPFYR
jgi:hypothetical protein